jgi:Ran GTPase-activating protein 1
MELGYFSGRLTKPGTSYKRLCFRNRSFGLDAANVDRPIVVSIRKQISELGSLGFVARRPEDEALSVMSIFSKAWEGSALRYLNMPDIPLGEKGI